MSRRLLFLYLALTVATGFSGMAQSPKFRHVEESATESAQHSDAKSKLIWDRTETNPSVTLSNEEKIDSMSPEFILRDIRLDYFDSLKYLNRSLGPWVFSGYRHLYNRPHIDSVASRAIVARLFGEMQKPDTEVIAREMEELNRADVEKYKLEALALGDTILPEEEDDILFIQTPSYPEPLPIMTGNVIPAWLRKSMTSARFQEDFMYRLMISDPSYIDYAYWDLPEPPRLPEEEFNSLIFIRKMNVPTVDLKDAVLPEVEINKKHWLHLLNGGIQFSQAYLSENWYQGGNNYLALLINFLWDVQLNQVWHPKMMFQSTLSYKLGLNSVEDDQYRKYSISQDLFQYNLKVGYKAIHNWYYSFTTQFKTQLMNNYVRNTMDRTASFLSPSDLTLGLGMTYSKQNQDMTLVFNASISPLSYNLKTCIDPDIDHTQFNIAQNKKCHSEFGSNAEINFFARIWNNVTYKTRLFLFTDYKYFVGDWENTLDFQFNKFFSTQLYLNVRYDSSADRSIAPGWNRWMLKEILSVGLSYTFSTKQ